MSIELLIIIIGFLVYQVVNVVSDKLGEQERIMQEDIRAHYHEGWDSGR